MLGSILAVCLLGLLFTQSNSHLKREEETITAKILAKQPGRGGIWLILSTNQRVWFDPETTANTPEVGQQVTATCVRQGSILAVLRLDQTIGQTAVKAYMTCDSCYVENKQLITRQSTYYIGDQLADGPYKQVIYQINTSGEIIILGGNQ